MAEPSSPSLLVTLVPVIVGGAIALAGSWLGPLFSDRRKEAAEKRQRRSAKFEEMVAAVYEKEITPAAGDGTPFRPGAGIPPLLILSLDYAVGILLPRG
jgi:hypothetical protein